MKNHFLRLGIFARNVLHVKVLYVQGIVLDKLASGFNAVTQEDRKKVVGLDGIFDADL